MICFLCQNPSLKAINEGGYIVQVDMRGNFIWSNEYQLNLNDIWEII